MNISDSKIKNLGSLEILEPYTRSGLKKFFRERELKAGELNKKIEELEKEIHDFFKYGKEKVLLFLDYTKNENRVYVKPNKCSTRSINPYLDSTNYDLKKGIVLESITLIRKEFLSLQKIEYSYVLKFSFEKNSSRLTPTLSFQFSRFYFMSSSLSFIEKRRSLLGTLADCELSLSFYDKDIYNNTLKILKNNFNFLFNKEKKDKCLI